MTASRFIIILSTSIYCRILFPSVVAWQPIEYPGTGLSAELTSGGRIFNPNNQNSSAYGSFHFGLPLTDPITIEEKLLNLTNGVDPMTDDDRVLLKIAWFNLRQCRADKTMAVVVEDSINRVHTWLYLQKCLNDAENLGLTLFKQRMMFDGWAKADRSQYRTVEDFAKSMIEIRWTKRSERWTFMFENLEDPLLVGVKTFALEAIKRYNSPKSAANEIELFGMEIDRSIQTYASCSSNIVGENILRFENQALVNLLYDTLTSKIVELRY